MNTNDDEDIEPITFEAFCSLLREILSSRTRSARENAKRVVNSIPIKARVRLLLYAVSSNNPYEMRHIALTKLNAIYASWLTETDDTYPELINDCMTFMTHVFLYEDSYMRQKDFCASCSILIEVINKNRIDKWKAIHDFVVACQTAEHETTKLMIFSLITKKLELFGKRRRPMFVQYKKFFANCFYEASSRPQLTILSMEAIEFLLWNNPYNFRKRTVFKLIPALIDAFENMVHEKEALIFMQYFNNLLDGFGNIFLKYSKKISKTIIKILSTKSIEKSVQLEVIRWISAYIQRYPYTLERLCATFIPIIIDLVLQFQIDTHFDQVNDWFEDFLTSGDIHSSPHATTAQSHLNDIAGSLESEFIFPMLDRQVQRKIISRNWVVSVTGIDLLGTVFLTCGRREVINPWEHLRILKPYLKSTNPVIVCSTINTIKIICLAFIAPEYISFHEPAMVTISSDAGTNGLLYAQMKAIDTIGCLARHFQGRTYQLKPLALLRLFSDVFAVFISSSNVQFMEFSAKLMTDNIPDLFRLIGSDCLYLIPHFTNSLLRMMDKLYRIPQCDSMYHCVLGCVKEMTVFFPQKRPDLFYKTVVKYVTDFRESHQLPNDTIDIPPCFFPFLLRVAEPKSECFLPIIPMLGYCIFKFLCEVRKIYMGHHKTYGLEFNQLAPPYVCATCYPAEGDCEEVTALCISASKFFADYSVELYSNVCLYLIFFQKMLKSDRNQTICHHFTHAITNLLNCALVWVDARWASRFWKHHLKHVFIRRIQNYSTQNVHKIIKDFTKCVSLRNLRDALDPMDLNSVGLIFDRLVCDCIQNAHKEYEPISEIGDQFMAIVNSALPYYIESILNSISECIRILLPIYKDKLISACFPMLNTIVTSHESRKFDIFPMFAALVLGDIIWMVLEKKFTLKCLVPKIINFCVDIMFGSYDVELYRKISKLTQKLKHAYKHEYEWCLMKHRPPIKCYFEDLILKEW